MNNAFHETALKSKMLIFEEAEAKNHGREKRITDRLLW